MQNKAFGTIASAVLLFWALSSCRPPDAYGPSDFQAPQEAANLLAGAGDGTVILSWTDPSDDDFLNVEITWYPYGYARQLVAAGAGT
jgi:hypothetical protein